MSHNQWALMEKGDALLAYLKSLLEEQRRTNELLKELCEQTTGVGGACGSVEPLPEVQPSGPAS
jgi:hypothetical protein